MGKMVILALALLQGTIYAQLSDRDSEKQLLFMYDPSSETANEELINPFNTTSNNSIIKKYAIDSLKYNSKNNIYAEASFCGIGGSATINYERMILHMGENHLPVSILEPATVIGFIGQVEEQQEYLVQIWYFSEKRIILKPV